MIFNEPPEAIWLQYNGDADPADYPNEPGPSADEVSWCWEPIFEHDIKYVLAEKVAELEAQKAAAYAEVEVQVKKNKRLKDALEEVRDMMGTNADYTIVAKKALEESE